MIWRRGRDDGDGALTDAGGLVVLMAIGEKMVMMVGKVRRYESSCEMVPFMDLCYRRGKMRVIREEGCCQGEERVSLELCL